MVLQVNKEGGILIGVGNKVRLRRSLAAWVDAVPVNVDDPFELDFQQEKLDLLDLEFIVEMAGGDETDRQTAEELQGIVLWPV
jgi:hypothetical protein